MIMETTQAEELEARIKKDILERVGKISKFHFELIQKATRNTQNALKVSDRALDNVEDVLELSEKTATLSATAMAVSGITILLLLLHILWQDRGQ